ncbi:hypothetical protein [Jannaschia sp. 2305UL9-9]|uniref:hypothetical protein n=1 Tax=Jannaschia sp. 2305UL9-9 TaxID=3121638 RepID=UPI0035281AAB
MTAPLAPPPWLRRWHDRWEIAALRHCAAGGSLSDVKIARYFALPMLPLVSVSAAAVIASLAGDLAGLGIGPWITIVVLVLVVPSLYLFILLRGWMAQAMQAIGGNPFYPLRRTDPVAAYALLKSRTAVSETHT